ncbi:type II toxin-antitoxin system Phd/YefM family antitoxin [Turneriella parva]|uniref:Antitoxin n=1 Tax=Turneriella parva (strain ATCC BAA-1111 / DSM 21527 / NCTC 11395 / H) TaxID=869212 RepID=I4B2K6_TURPD|nr:type II toxin-antitoxin system prevent-host-death family antitoxin [Turneriella parva]AFM11513.1 prevent-host-death family protein [Turneriella parva DSM 21527]
MQDALMVADFKARFSDVLAKVRNGEEVVLEYGRRHEKIAVLVPYEKYRRLTAGKTKRQAGTLAGKVEVFFGKDFKMTDQEFLDS